MKLVKILCLAILIFFTAVVTMIFFIGDTRRDADIAADSLSICLKVPGNCIGYDTKAIYGVEHPTKSVENGVNRDFQAACIEGVKLHTVFMKGETYVHKYECESGRKYVYLVYIAYRLNWRTIHLDAWHRGYWAPCDSSCELTELKLAQENEIEIGQIEAHQ